MDEVTRDDPRSSFASPHLAEVAVTVLVKDPSQHVKLDQVVRITHRHDLFSEDP